MGQGTYTAIATILADELDADWTQNRMSPPRADVGKYANSRYKAQGAGKTLGSCGSPWSVRKRIELLWTRWRAALSRLSLTQAYILDATVLMNAGRARTRLM